MSDIIIVDLLRPMLPYEAGDRAGFAPAHAEALIRSGFARRVEAEPVTALRPLRSTRKLP